jgi:F420-non-reducing hydrogenase large subunit
MKEIIIDPITRLEGHGKIAIFLNDAGEVENAYLQIPELRGFERFCIGRKAEDMPLLNKQNMRSLPRSPPHGWNKSLRCRFQRGAARSSQKVTGTHVLRLLHLRPHFTLLLSWADQTSLWGQTHHQKNAMF